MTQCWSLHVVNTLVYRLVFMHSRLCSVRQCSIIQALFHEAWQLPGPICHTIKDCPWGIAPASSYGPHPTGSLSWYCEWSFAGVAPLKSACLAFNATCSPACQQACIREQWYCFILLQSLLILEAIHLFPTACGLTNAAEVAGTISRLETANYRFFVRQKCPFYCATASYKTVHRRFAHRDGYSQASLQLTCFAWSLLLRVPRSHGPAV